MFKKSILVFIFLYALSVGITESTIAQDESKFAVKTDEILYERLVDLLKVHKAYNNNQLIKLIRNGRKNDGGYVVPEIAFEKADVLMGYGIADDISFEEQFSNKYNKESFGFDCGVKKIKIKNKLCHFVNECIANDHFLYGGQQSSKKFATYTEQLKKRNLQDKKIFIKMDIEGAEYDAFPEIFKHKKNITGIVLEIHTTSAGQIKKAVDLVSALNKNFLLIHVHGNNCCSETFEIKNAIGRIPKVLELTYVNKLLVSKSEVSSDQKHPTDVDMPNCKKLNDYKFEMLRKTSLFAATT